MNRRDFTTLLSGALLGLAVPGSVSAAPRRGSRLDALFGADRQETYFTWVRVADGVTAVLGGGGNSMVVQGRNGALVSDAKNFGLGTTLRRESEAQGLPVRWFVNTHHHGDHSGGNAAFADVERVAHRNTEPRIRETAARNLGRATEVLDALAQQVAAGDAPAELTADIDRARGMLAAATPDTMVPETLHSGEYAVDVDGAPVELRWISAGHTDGDSFLYLPDRNVIHAGDLIFDGRHPFVDVSSGSTPQGWIGCLDAMLEVADSSTAVIPGHGTVGGRERIETQREYFLQLTDIVERGLRDGRTRDEIVASEPENLVSLSGADRFLPTNLGIVYDELAG